MEKKTIFGLICAACVLLLLIPTSSDDVGPTPDDGDASAEVVAAFDTYQRLWLDLNLNAAEKLDSEEFTTDQQVWDYLASGQEPARKVAFEEIAKKEQKLLGDGKWDPKVHSSLLRSYSGE